MNGLHEPSLIRFASSSIHGTGAFAAQHIAQGTRIIEYLGERISKSESLARCEAGNHFIFEISAAEDLDGNVETNPARFINHSCAPNCDAINDNGRIWIVSTRLIAAGEEITFNYGFDLSEYKDYPCQCGAQNCIGYILAEEFFDHVRRAKENLRH